MKNPVERFLTVTIVLLLVALVSVQLWRAENKAPITMSTLQQTPDALENPGTEPERLNINTATAEQLQALPGIGAVLAQRILDYRQENGNFQTVSELTMVKGIGISLLDKIMDDITV